MRIQTLLALLVLCFGILTASFLLSEQNSRRLFSIFFSKETDSSIQAQALLEHGSQGDLFTESLVPGRCEFKGQEESHWVSFEEDGEALVPTRLSWGPAGAASQASEDSENSADLGQIQGEQTHSAELFPAGVNADGYSVYQIIDDAPEQLQQKSVTPKNDALAFARGQVRVLVKNVQKDRILVFLELGAAPVSNPGEPSGQYGQVGADGTGTYYTTRPSPRFLTPLKCSVDLATRLQILSQTELNNLQVVNEKQKLRLVTDSSHCAQDSSGLTHCFESRILPLSDITFDTYYKFMNANTLNPTWKCPATRETLSYLWLTHFDMQEQIRVGELIVASSAAKEIVRAFAQIFAAKFPIARMHPQDYYKGVDALSMAANNTSAFRCSKDSQDGEHPKGLAVDINPLINPFIKPNEKKFYPIISSRAGENLGGGYQDPPPSTLAEALARYQIEPLEGWNYAFKANRLKERSAQGKNLPGMIFEDSAPTRAFESIGWFWGGKWNCCADYQHFSSNDM